MGLNFIADRKAGDVLKQTDAEFIEKEDGELEKMT